MQRSSILARTLLGFRHHCRPVEVKMLQTTARVFAKPGKRGKRKFVDAVIVKTTKSTKRTIDIYNYMTISELAKSLNVDIDSVGERLMELDLKFADSLDDEFVLDKENTLHIVSAFGGKPRLVPRPRLAEDNDEAQLDLLPPVDPAECVRRPPVVTIMGHVDHGKTTLLDSLRNSRIAEGEFGGITQHIGAFSVNLSSAKQSVTFLDTPGHAAFGQMRSRGAMATDIVILVVAADDGVKEQTIESIKYARQAGVAMIVAINKCDKPNADPARAKRSLLEHDVVTEDLGGDIQAVEISALHGTNLDALQEAILLQADFLELKSTEKGPVEGVVIESTNIQGIGKVCTMIVQRGTLRKGSVLVAGDCWGRVRSLTDEFGRTINEAGPSRPVRISGWRDDLPSPGDTIQQIESEQKAQKVVAARKRKQMEEKAVTDWKAIEVQREKERELYLANRQRLLNRGIRYGSTLRRIVHKEQQIFKDTVRTHPLLRILLRSDVDGTLEAILNVLETYDSDSQCEMQLVDFGVGPPNDKDIELASESNAIVYCFNTKMSPLVRQLADQKNVRVEHHNVIYRLVESVKNELSALIPPVEELKQVAEGHVLKEFLISDRGRKRQPIAGVLVDWGTFNRNHLFRFLRGSTTIYEGEVESMKAGPEVVNTAKTNTEIGVALTDKSIRFEEDDIIEVYERIQMPQCVTWNPRGF
uniref:Tr-type G domain-containing protein n=1 Tax=Steinernema glaseri TaxID=37863 RepID=A0A1I8AIX7_9BILA